MANPWAGEVEIVVDGRRRVMKLTLGALAELEAALEAGSLSDLLDRFEGGQARAGDLLLLLWAALRGGGWRVDPATVARAEFEGGLAAAMAAAARVLVLAFAGAAA